jgi:hypothetical protein
MEQNETRVLYPVHISCKFYGVQVKYESKQFVSYVNQFMYHIRFSIRLYAVYTPVWRQICFCLHQKSISETGSVAPVVLYLGIQLEVSGHLRSAAALNYSLGDSKKNNILSPLPGIEPPFIKPATSNCETFQNTAVCNIHT